MTKVYKVLLTSDLKAIKTVEYSLIEKEVRWHSTFLDIAKRMGDNSHCVSHKVGAVLVKNNRIISTGINGTPSGHTNCDEVFDANNFDRQEHHEWSNLNELHAEINALMIAAREGIATKDSIIYVTISPCTSCCKAIVAAGIRKVIFSELYDADIEGLKLLLLNDTEVYLIDR